MTQRATDARQTKYVLDEADLPTQWYNIQADLDLPVRLIAFPEGALQAFNDEVLDLDHAQFARECAIDIPGEETEELSKIARAYDTFIMAQAKARHPDWPDCFFREQVIKPQIRLMHERGIWVEPER